MNPKKNAIYVGRELELFHHRTQPEWGYKEEREDSFAVLYPKEYTEKKVYPLYVVFHSAGHDIYECLMKNEYEGDHDIYHAPEGMFGLYLDCRTHAKDDWWWGGVGANHYEDRPERYGTDLTPVEKRVIDTIKWVIENYPVDQNRVYGVGNSMGGSGVLGIGLNHGDIFAAIKANVPAGIVHAEERCMLNRERPADFHIPDPPVVVDYSAQNDSWSEGHERFYQGMERRRYALMGFWGVFGHANNHKLIAEKNDLIHNFDIFSVRKDCAYPVFTHASTDDRIPWPDQIDSEESGQVNAFFRWEIIEDSPSAFEAKLWLAGEEECPTRLTLPTEATADLLFRRVQHFKPNPGEKLICLLNGIEKAAEADGEGLLTVEKLKVTREPLTLRFVRQVSAGK